MIYLKNFGKLLIRIFFRALKYSIHLKKLCTFESTSKKNIGIFSCIFILMRKLSPLQSWHMSKMLQGLIYGCFITIWTPPCDYKFWMDSEFIYFYIMKALLLSLKSEYSQKFVKIRVFFLKVNKCCYYH